MKATVFDTGIMVKKTGDPAFGARLRQARERKGYASVPALVSALQDQCPGLTPKQVGGWERGDRSPDMQALPVIAAACGVSVDYLLSGRLVPEGSRIVNGEPSPAPLNVAAPSSDVRSGAVPVEQRSDDQVDWKSMAQQLLEIMRMRETNEELRIKTVEAPDAQARADLAAAVRAQYAPADGDTPGRPTPPHTGGDPGAATEGDHDRKDA